MKKKYQGVGRQAEYQLENDSGSSLGVVPLCSACEGPETVASSYLTTFSSEISTKSVKEAVTAPGVILAACQQEYRPFLCPGQLSRGFLGSLKAPRTLDL